MQKLLFLLLFASLLVINSLAQATTVVDFDAVAIRGANATPHTSPTISESNENGATVNTPLAGQKAYYGTDYFNGWVLSSIESIAFTYAPSSGAAPYSNVVITDGSAYGIISSQGGYSAALGEDKIRETYYFSGKNGNSDNSYNFKFYEGVNTALSGIVTWSTIKDWYLLGVGALRPLSTGETNNPEQPGVARGPLVDALTVLWGDSAANYLGEKRIWDVQVTAIKNGQTENYVAGAVPEPSTMLLLGFGLAGLAGVARKKMKR